MLVDPMFFFILEQAYSVPITSQCQYLTAESEVFDVCASCVPPWMRSIPLTAGRKAVKIKKNSPFAGACLSVCLSVCSGLLQGQSSMSIVKARRCTTASTRLAVARKKERERERKTSGILGAYAAGLMILILILSCI